MPKEWDDSMKRLVRENPQHFISWILPGAVFKRAMSLELKNRTRQTDYLPEVTLNNEDILVDFEFQSRDDSNMEHRLLEYNVLATLEHHRRVLTCVIYLRKDNNIAESPLIWALPNGQETLRFYYVVIKLWEIPAEEILQTGLLGLLPLLPLAKDGKRHDLIEEMIIELAFHEKYELLLQAKTIAGLVFQGATEHEWLERKFAVYKDIIEESWVYQEIIKKGFEKGLEQGLEKGLEQGIEKGLEKGLEQGLEKGLEKGKVEALQGVLLDVINDRFPDITVHAKKRIEEIEDPKVLRHLTVRMNTIQTPEEALQVLLDLNTDSKKN